MTSSPAPKKKKPAAGSAQARANKQIKTAYAQGTTEANAVYGAGSLGRLADPTAVANVSAPAPASKVSTDMAGGSQSIAQAEQAYDDASTHDAYVTSALNNLQALTGGMSGPEMAATEETANASAKTSAATNLRAMKIQQAASGVTGAAAAGQQQGVYNTLGSTERSNATSTIAQNFQDMLNAGTAFSSAATTANSQYQTAKNNALTTLMGARQSVADYQQKGETANQAASEQDASNQIATNSQNTGINEYNTTNAINTALTNLSQTEKEKAGYVGVKYGQAGVDLAAVAQNEQNDLSKQAIAAAQAS